MQRLEIEEMQRTLMENLKKKLYKSEKRVEKKLRVLEIALSWNVGHEREREICGSGLVLELRKTKGFWDMTEWCLFELT